MKKNWLGPLISAVLIGLLYVLLKDQIPAILSALKNANHLLIGVCVVIFMSTIFVLGVRLQLIFSAEDIPIRLREAVNLTFVGCFFNNFLPTSVGGDIVKALCAAKVTKEPVKSVTTVMMDRIFGLFTFILIPSISLAFLQGKINPRVPVLVYSFLTFSALFFLLLFNRAVARNFHFVERLLNRLNIGSMVRKIYDGMHNFRNHKRIIAEAMILSVLGQSVGIFVLYLLGVALGADQSTLPYFFLLVPVVHLISMLPSINGLGIREGAYIYFLQAYIGTDRAAAIGILWLALTLLASVVGGIIYFMRHDYHIQFKQAQRGIE